MTARTLGLVLALWLFFSGFAWPRTAAGVASACAAGLLAAVAALAGMHRPRARFLATAVSAWVVASAFLLAPPSATARWNDLAVGLALLAASLVPGTLYPPQARRAAA